MLSKKLRLSRIINPETGRTVTVPMDHGLYRGPAVYPTLANPAEITKKLVEGGVDAIIVHRGIAKNVVNEICGKTGLVIKLTDSTISGPEPSFQALLSSVEDAIKIGADAISVEVQCRSPKEIEMLKILGKTAEACDDWGMPLLAMMYFVPDEKTDAFDAKTLSHVARIGAELGADIIKTRYTGSSETFKEVVEGCPVPVVIAGGPKVANTKQALEALRGAMDAGAIGVSWGRNVFQHENPTKMVKALRKVIHENATVEEALMELK